MSRTMPNACNFISRLVSCLLAAALSLPPCLLFAHPAPAHASDAGRSSEGSAYAVITNDGQFVLLRSTNYSSGSTITDILGNSYTGTVYSGIEEMDVQRLTNLPWYSTKASIVSACVAPGQRIAPKSTSYWFSNCTNLTSVDIEGLDTSATTNMNQMFYNCSKLQALDLSTLETPSVKTMRYLFGGMTTLETLDISRFDVSSVTAMDNIFYNVPKLWSISLGDKFSFTDFGAHPEWASSTKLPTPASDAWVRLGGLDEQSAYDLACAYDGSSMAGTYTAAPSSNAILDEEGNLVLFRCASRLTTGAGQTVTDTAGVVRTGHVYANVPREAGLYTRVPWYADKAEVKSVSVAEGQRIRLSSLEYWFYGCTNLVSADLSGLTLDAARMSAACLFYDCKSLTDLKLPSLAATPLSNTAGMFQGCSSLVALDLSEMDTSGASNMNGMFDGASQLMRVVLGQHFSFKGSASSPQTGLPLPAAADRWATPDAYGAAYTPEELAETYDGESMAGVYVWTVGSYAVLTDGGELIFIQSPQAYSPGAGQDVVDIAGNEYHGRVYSGIQSTGTYSNNASWNRNNVPWYNQRDSIVSVRVAQGQHVSIGNMSCWFYDCVNLRHADLAGVETSGVEYFDFLFCNCENLEELDLSCLDTSSAIDMSYMLSGCPKLATVNLGGLETGNAKSMRYLFNGCSSLALLDISSFDTSACTDMAGVFQNCSKLERVVFGERFAPTGDGIKASGRGSVDKRALLPTPPTSSTYSGSWMRLDRAYGPFTPDELAKEYDGATMSGAYVWATGIVTLQFDANGGTFSGDNRVTVKALSGGPMRYPEEGPTRAYHEFAGWQMQPEGDPVHEEVVGDEGGVFWASWTYDAQLTFTVPSELPLVRTDDGSLACASTGLRIANSGKVPLHVESVSVDPAQGIELVELGQAAPDESGARASVVLSTVGDSLDISKFQGEGKGMNDPDAWNVPQADPSGNEGVLELTANGFMDAPTGQEYRRDLACVHWTLGIGAYRHEHGHLADYTVRELEAISRDLAADGTASQYYYEFNGYILAGETWGAVRSDGVTVNGESLMNGFDEANEADRFLEVRIAGINHDEKSDGTGTAGLTFISTRALPQKYMMNLSTTNVGGWECSNLRARMNPEAWIADHGASPTSADGEASIWNCLPEVLRKSIVAVKKKTNNLGGYSSSRKYEITTTSDKLFAPSVAEVFGDRGGAAMPALDGCGVQYPWFALDGQWNSNSKLAGATFTRSGANQSMVWLRDPATSSGSVFYGINDHTYFQEAGTADSYKGVIVCFCL